MYRARMFVVLFVLISILANAQDANQPITNADVVSMTKSGIGEQTIILSIKQGVTKFDISSQGLIELKKAGVADQVLNAMLAASLQKDEVKMPAVKAELPGTALLQKALEAIGPAEKLAQVHGTLSKTTATVKNQGVVNTYDREFVRSFPDKIYQHVRGASGQTSVQVVTSDFGYRESGKMTTTIPSDNLQSIRTQLVFDKFNIAQHLADYSAFSEGQDTLNGSVVDVLKITHDGEEVLWELDPHSGRLLGTKFHKASGDVINEFSDFREISGIYTPFRQHTVESGLITDQVVGDYEINPTANPSLFERPKALSADSLSFKVIQEQSVPYTQESGGGVNTSCNISGSANSVSTVNSVGSTAYGSGTTNSNMHMNCNSYDTTIRWPHVLNTMFIEASDGNAYIIACDRAWRWSKCVPLRTGQTFNAKFTSKGMEVQAFNSKGKEDEPVYRVLQSKSMK
jgi:hypothetical protein